ncbi:MAG: ubiquinol-cytochrome c reductase iron-sulfur subunit [Haloarculaceae archaeon]
MSDEIDTETETDFDAHYDGFGDAFEGTREDIDPGRDDEVAGDEPLYGQQELTRRQVAKTLAAISGGAAVAGFTVNALAGLSTAGHLAAEQGGGKLYVKGTRLVDGEGKPLSLDTLPKDEPKSMKVFPKKDGGGALKTARATTLLMRFPEDDYGKPTNVDETVNGYVAYSAVCTHEGCAVGTEGATIVCPCHKSKYDPTAGAKVVGGPAPRALPQLPLGVADDSEKSLIIATGPFEGPIGPSE